MASVLLSSSFCLQRTAFLAYAKNTSRDALHFSSDFLKKRYDVYPCYLLCFPYPYFPVICILPKQKKDYIICRILNGKEGIYVTGLLSRLTIKSMFFCRSTLENMQLYMKLHFWILFKDRVSIFFRVSIVSILLSMEFEWT